MNWMEALPADGFLGGVEFVWYAAPPRKPIFGWVTQSLREFPWHPEGLFLGLLPDFEPRLYRPLAEHRALFRTFAATDPTPEGCLKFANTYGSLGRGEAHRVNWSRKDRPASFPVYYPGDHWNVNQRRPEMEPFNLWRDAIATMRHLISLWLLADRNDKALADFVMWDGGRVVLRGMPAPTFLAGRSGPAPSGATNEVWAPEDMAPAPGEPPLFAEGDLAGPALLFVQRHINPRLAGAVSPRLYWSIARRRPELTYVPGGLLEALYLQFAQAIGQGKRPQYRQCPVCERFFEVARGAARSNRNACSGTCRTYLYRRRMAKARELHDEGKGAREIAKELKANLSSVKKWIAKES
jgi:hypothetical protein